MMNVIGFILVALVMSLCGQEVRAEGMKVRTYRAEVESFVYGVAAEGKEAFEGKKGEVYAGLRLEEAPFESRFFREGDALLDFTGWGKLCGLLEGEEERAIFNEKSGRLVVRAELRDHCFLGDYLEGFVRGQMKVEFRLVKMPGVELGRMDLKLARVEKVGKELARVAGLAQPGRSFQLRTPGGELVWEGECQVDLPDPGWDCRCDLECGIVGGEFDFRSCFEGVLGLPTMMELGSFDGESTLVGIWKVSQVLADGSDYDDWMQAEEEGDLVMEERVRGILHKDKGWLDLENGKRYQVFEVPPTFMTFIRGEDDEAMSLREVFRKNGVDLKADDRLFWMEGGNLLAVEAAPLSVELIEGITIAAGPDPDVGVFGGSYVLVESKEKLGLEELKKGDFKILRKINVNGGPGGGVTMEMGEEFLEVESESYANGDDQFVETRMLLSAEGELVLKGEVEAKAGVPVILKQEKVGEVWRTWVVTLSVRYFGDVIAEGR